MHCIVSVITTCLFASYYLDIFWFLLRKSDNCKIPGFIVISILGYILEAHVMIRYNYGICIWIY
jgi:hypothetical protein